MRLFDEDRFLQLARDLQHDYRTAQPYPHVVIDDFLPVDLAREILAAFPRPEAFDWYRFDRHHSKKLATTVDPRLPGVLNASLMAFNTAGCLRFLEDLTGIEGLIPDPYFEGGGLHQIERDGFLKVHTDFNWHKKLRLDRRVNLIVYFNENWQDEYQGHLELWDAQVTRCVKRILPIFNRCVIFNTTDSSYHGHPVRLTCPEGMTRKSLALYYYTNGRPEEEKSAPHGTVWRERPGERRSRSKLARLLERARQMFLRPAGHTTV